MNRTVALVLVVAFLGIGGWYLLSAKNEGGSSNLASQPTADRTSPPPPSGDALVGGQSRMSPLSLDGDGEMVMLKPAPESYTSAKEALDRVRTAAKDYDDLVLEQFTNPDPSCSWCPEFYTSLRELVKTSDLKPDERSYFAELLAVSGRKENVQSLIDGVKNPPTPEDADLFAEALELTVGNPEIVALLGEHTKSENPKVKEGVTAALTNQGTLLAAEILYKSAVESNDPRGMYDLGIGLGEFIPDDETMPFLQEAAQKRDPYSHLAVKSLLNGGISGLRRVIAVFSTNTNSDFDTQVLMSAVDHVAYDEDTEKELKRLAAGSNQVLQAFSKKVLEGFEADNAIIALDGDEGEGDATEE